MAWRFRLIRFFEYIGNDFLYMYAEKHALPTTAIVSFFLEGSSAQMEVINAWGKINMLNDVFVDVYVKNRKLLEEYNQLRMNMGRSALTMEELSGLMPLPEAHRKALLAYVPAHYDSYLDSLAEYISKKLGK